MNYTRSEKSTTPNPFDVLRAWQIRNFVTTKAMQDLLRISPDIGLTGFPKDWRTVIRRYNKKMNQLKVAEIIEVCSKCFLHRFPSDDVNQAAPCAHCSYARLTCPRCHYHCILASSVGNKPKKYISQCKYCGVNSDIKVTLRSYIFDIVGHLQHLFGDQAKAQKLLAPFVDMHGKPLYHFSSVTELESGEGAPRKHFEESPGWLNEWRSACQSSNFYKELWHGSRFFNHSLFEDHGMRSVLLEVSLDWFPPHKDKQKYSVGVLSCCPANYSLQERSKMENIFVLAVLEGPTEPLHTLAMLSPVFKRISTLDAHGVSVFDSLTSTQVNVHVSVGICVADAPAAAKLGSFIGHSGYLPCHRCSYKACLCGCKFDNSNQKRGTWDNESISFPASLTRPSVLQPGLRDNNKKKKGEHMAFIENNLVKRHQLRNDTHIRTDQVNVGLLLWTVGYVKARYNEMKSELRVTCVSPLTILPSKRFNLVYDFGLDGLHTLLKGIGLRLIELTFDEKYEKKPYNLRFEPKSKKLHEFSQRMRRFQWPTRDTAPQRLHKSTGGLKAAEIWFFFKVQCLIVLDGLLPNENYIIWTLMAKLVCALMHTHVSKSWIQGTDGACLDRLFRTLYDRFLACYGKCNMPYNFHVMLHCQHDCIDWSSLRSHSTFKFERLYHELIMAPRSNGSNKITQSIVRAVCELPSRHTKFIHNVISSPMGWPLSLPDASSIPCLLSVLQSAPKFVIAAQDMFGGTWKYGQLITVIDHSLGSANYVGALACTIECIILRGIEFMALLYPVKISAREHGRITGSFKLQKRSQFINDKFFVTSLSNVPDHMHICHVGHYNDADGSVLYVPLCGPLPQGDD